MTEDTASIVSRSRTLKVLLLGSHLGYNLEHYAKMALERLGCEVRFVGYRDSLGTLATPMRMVISRSKIVRRFIEQFALRKFHSSAMQVGLEFRPNLVLAIKGEAILPTAVDWFSQTLGAVTALWCPDDPRYFESLSKVIAPHYDFVFTPTERFVSEYLDAGVAHVQHVPFGCEPTVHKPAVLSTHETQKLACDICFVGTYSRRRAAIIKALARKKFKVSVWGPYWRFFGRDRYFHGPVLGPDLAKVFTAARLVLNSHDEADMNFKPNMRTFEATACESLLLSDKPHGLEQFFEPNFEVVCYEDEAHLIKLASYYLQSPNETAAIAARGHDRALRDHTYDQRLKIVLRNLC